MPKKELFGRCPYVTAQKVLTGKWSMYIMYLLSQEPVIRFNELLRRMPEEMTHATLSRQLKTLEEEGLICRTEYAQVPPRVEYSLSEIGKRFESVLKVLGEWGDEYIQFMKEQHGVRHTEMEENNVSDSGFEVDKSAENLSYQ